MKKTVTIESAFARLGTVVSGRLYKFVMCFLCAIFLIFAVLAVIGPMFGIAALVDKYSYWMLLLYIPWLITLPITGKPLKMIFDLVAKFDT